MKKQILLLAMVPFIGFGNINKEVLPLIIISNVRDSLSFEHDIKRFSAGLKFGLPYMVAIGAQYTLPFFDNHFAPYFDYSRYSYEDFNREAQFRFSEWGISYFVREKGKGVYLGLSNSNLSYQADFTNIVLKNDSKGSGTGKVDMRTTNLRLGLKTAGTLYFRIEIGYGFGNLPKLVTFTATDDFNPNHKELTIKDIPGIDGVSEKGMLVGNLGFGISF